MGPPQGHLARNVAAVVLETGEPRAAGSGKEKFAIDRKCAGVLCEGLETSDPAVMGPLAGMVDRLEVHMELWVDAQTQYPVRFEGKMAGEAEGQVMASECVMDQFQWDVELDPSLFELNIPADYVSMRDL